MYLQLLQFLVLFNVLFGFGDISRRKCEEYSKAVYMQEDSPVLLPNARPNTVSACGIAEVPLIVGGITAHNKEFPHMALIGFGISPNAELAWQCGGSLISEIFVLTAAHCLNSRDSGPARKVKLGIVDIFSSRDLQETYISARIPHPDYKPPSKYNDIALLRLLDVVRFTPFVHPACLNTRFDIQNDKAIATGFGKLSYDAKNGSKHLMKVQLTLISNAKCQLHFIGGPQRMLISDGVTDSLLCAGELSGGKDTCQGDSGGPLQIVLKKPYCMYSLIGITSFGKFCGFPNSPAIYTRVSQYVNWIEANVWQ